MAKSSKKQFVPEAQRAEEYARDVVAEMLRFRGYTAKGAAPQAVVDDVHKEIVGYDQFYTHCFANHVAPKTAAALLQDKIWMREMRGHKNPKETDGWLEYEKTAALAELDRAAAAGGADPEDLKDLRKRVKQINKELAQKVKAGPKRNPAPKKAPDVLGKPDVVPGMKFGTRYKYSHGIFIDHVADKGEYHVSQAGRPSKKLGVAKSLAGAQKIARQKGDFTRALQAPAPQAPAPQAPAPQAPAPQARQGPQACPTAQSRALHSHRSRRGGHPAKEDHEKDDAAGHTAIQ